MKKKVKKRIKEVEEKAMEIAFAKRIGCRVKTIDANEIIEIVFYQYLGDTVHSVVIPVTFELMEEASSNFTQAIEYKLKNEVAKLERYIKEKESVIWQQRRKALYDNKKDNIKTIKNKGAKNKIAA